MIFHQPFEPSSSTYASLLAGVVTRRALLIVIMVNPQLAYPRQIDRALSADLHCGMEVPQRG